MTPAEISMNLLPFLRFNQSRLRPQQHRIAPVRQCHGFEIRRDAWWRNMDKHPVISLVATLQKPWNRLKSYCRLCIKGARPQRDSSNAPVSSQRSSFQALPIASSAVRHIETWIQFMDHLSGLIVGSQVLILRHSNVYSRSFVWKRASKRGLWGLKPPATFESQFQVASAGNPRFFLLVCPTSLVTPGIQDSVFDSTCHERLRWLRLADSQARQAQPCQSLGCIVKHWGEENLDHFHQFLNVSRQHPPPQQQE